MLGVKSGTFTYSYLLTHTLLLGRRSDHNQIPSRMIKSFLLLEANRPSFFRHNKPGNRIPLPDCTGM
jgi:hypothetical protein